MDNIELITQPMRELSEKMSSMVNPLSSIVSNIPSIVLPEIELPKFNIPNYFNDIETKDDDKQVSENNNENLIEESLKADNLEETVEKEEPVIKKAKPKKGKKSK